MLLASVRIVNVPPFDHLEVPFCDDDGAPRRVTVLFGGAGVGKTTVLNAIASTRPGHAVALPPADADAPRIVECRWALGQDDPQRPHVLRVAPPNVSVDADDVVETVRRREQALFDKVARRGGFAFSTLSSTRWFSKQPVALNAPARTVARYDVRALSALDDASRSDLTRETKQALAYAEIAAALPRDDTADLDFGLLGDAMRAAVDDLVGLAGFSYVGLNPRSLEPLFEGPNGRARAFDALPRQARHLVAFAALPTRTLWAAYPGVDPRESEGVFAIDEVDLHQDAQVQGRLVAHLSAALPAAQWILTTTSPTLANSCDHQSVLALRRLPDENGVELYSGPEARVH